MSDKILKEKQKEKLQKNKCKTRLATRNCIKVPTVLISFKDQVQAQAKQIEEGNALARSLKKELDLKDLIIIHQEKTILEQENLLQQLNRQLDDMEQMQENTADITAESTSQLNTVARWLSGVRYFK